MKVSTTDTWSALFELWHKKTHERELLADLHDILSRIERLEAFMAARMLGVEQAPIDPID